MKEKRQISVNICYLLEQKRWTLTKLSKEIKKTSKTIRKEGNQCFLNMRVVGT